MRKFKTITGCCFGLVPGGAIVEEDSSQLDLKDIIRITYKGGSYVVRKSDLKEIL